MIAHVSTHLVLLSTNEQIIVTEEVLEYLMLSSVSFAGDFMQEV